MSQASFLSPIVRARPYLIRAAVAGAIALGAFIVAATLGQFKATAGDPLVKDTERAIAIGAALLLLMAGVVAVRAVAKAVKAAAGEPLGAARSAPVVLLITAVGYLMVVLSILGALQVPLGGLLFGGALTGVIIGMAAQQTLGNFFAGVVLLLVHPFSVGDHVVLRSGVGEYEGLAIDVGMFYTKIVTDRGEVALPNSAVLASAVGPGAKSPKES